MLESLSFPWQRACTVCGCSVMLLCVTPCCSTAERESEQRLDREAVWPTAAVCSCPGTTGCDAISLDILSHTVSLFSSGQAPMQRPPWINAAFVKSFYPSEQLSTAPQALFCSATRAQVHVCCQGSGKWTFKLRDSFHYRATLDIMLKKNVSLEAIN